MILYPEIFLFGLGLLWLVFASVQDWKTREIANWLNFSLLIFALSFRFFYAVFFQRWDFFASGIFGVGIFFLLAHILYYGHVFAGGDAKLLIALGAVLPIYPNYFQSVSVFLILFFLFAFFYGMIWSASLAFFNWKNVRKKFIYLFNRYKTYVFLSFPFVLIFLIAGFFSNFMFAIAFIIFILPFLYLFAKSIDEVCMVHACFVKGLREGDWLYQDVKAGKKVIRAKWAGISTEEISLLSRVYGKNKKIFVREGVPFAPVFLFSFLAYLFLWYSSLWSRIDFFLFNFFF